MERETGFEPATPCLEGRNSTTELLPLGLLSAYEGGASPVNFPNLAIEPLGYSRLPQVSPVFSSTDKGTASESDAGISSITTADSASSSSLGASKISSSWT